EHHLMQSLQRESCRVAAVEVLRQDVAVAALIEYDGEFLSRVVLVNQVDRIDRRVYASRDGVEVGEWHTALHRLSKSSIVSVFAVRATPLVMQRAVGADLVLVRCACAGCGERRPDR